MIELSDNAAKTYQLAKKIASPVMLKELRHFVVGLPTELRQRLFIFGQDNRRVIAELETAELLKPVFGKKIVREIVLAVKDSYTPRRQNVHEVVMWPDNEIEIVADAQVKRKKEKREPFSISILLASQDLLQTLPKAKTLVSSAIAIIKKPQPSAEERKDLEETIRQLDRLNPKATVEAEAIGLESAIKALREFLKTKPPAASPS